MAVHLNYDTDLRIIYVITPPTNQELTLDVKVDIYSDMKEDWLTNSILNRLKFPLSEPVGGDTITPTKSISAYYFLKYGWRMRPYEANHTLYLDKGYLLIQGGGNPWVRTLGNYTVNIRDSIPADSFTETILSGSGLSQTEHDHLLALNTSNLDVLVSTRLATVNYVAPDNQGIIDIETKVNVIDNLIDDIHNITGNRVSRTGNIITCYLDDGVTPWRQYDLSNGGRLQL